MMPFQSLNDVSFIDFNVSNKWIAEKAFPEG